VNELPDNEAYGFRNIRITTFSDQKEVSSVISDLTSESFTDADVTGWNFFGLYNGPSPLSTCGSVTLLGGYNKFAQGSSAQKLYTLPPHDSILLQIDIWELDTIDAESITIFVDGVAIDTIAKHTPISSLCGNPSALDHGLFPYAKFFSHSASTFSLKLNPNLDSPPYDESYGFRNIRITTFFDIKALTYYDISDLATPLISDNEVTGWTFTGFYNSPSYLSSCWGVSMLGGYNKFGKNSVAQKVYTLPPHHYVFLQIDIYEIDTLDNEYLYIYVDGNLLQGILNMGSSVNSCGNFYNDAGLFPFRKYFYHTNTTLTLKISTNVDETPDTESFGFRNIRITAIADPNQQVSKPINDLDSLTFTDANLQG